MSNISHIVLAREAELEPYGDFRLNITHSYSRESYFALGVERSILSAELSPLGVRAIGGGAIVYGRVPLMLTERCYMSNGRCGGVCPDVPLTDRKGARFPMVREWKHRNVIFNSIPTYMADRADVLAKYKILGGHFVFSNETRAEVDAVIEAYRNGSPSRSGRIRRIN